ncbi:hypothetical protein FISHEDRAFT_47350, partial [Fistulina hepatica ATCC 64428]
WGLTAEYLTIFINSAEWTLTSGVLNDPVFHPVLFVPSAMHHSLHVLDSDMSDVSPSLYRSGAALQFLILIQSLLCIYTSL